MGQQGCQWEESPPTPTFLGCHTKRIDSEDAVGVTAINQNKIFKNTATTYFSIVIAMIVKEYVVHCGCSM